MTTQVGLTSRTMQHIATALTLGLLLAMVGASYASAGVKKGSDWYFRGSTYRDKAVKQRVDPVSLLFLGGGGDVTSFRVGSHLVNDWTAGSMQPTPPVCRSNQYMRWRHLPGGDVDKTDISYNTSRTCKRQFHFRGWDDYEHSTGTGHVRFQWLVGGIHHENRGAFSLGHHIDRDWDLVRYEAVKAMKRHCSYLAWRFHPGAAREYQGIGNTGYIARISMRHTSEGCGGA